MNREKEDYLKEIYNLQISKNRAVKVSELSKVLKISKPSISQMVRKLAKEDYVHFKRFGGISLTEKGIKQARTMVRKHQILEVFFNKMLDIKHNFHQEAHEVEHSLSDQATDKLDKMLKQPKICPDGNPIPSKKGQVIKLTTLTDNSDAEVVFAATQSKECLERLNSLGLVPQVKIKVVRKIGKGPLIILVRGSEIALGPDICSEIFVEKK